MLAAGWISVFSGSCSLRRKDGMSPQSSVDVSAYVRSRENGLA